jgi:hypothetical protein
VRFARILPIAMLVTMCSLGEARAAEPPLFSAFKKFCAETDAKPDAVKAAIKGAGGRLSKGPVNSGGWPFAVGLTIWNVTIEGRDIDVSASVQRIPPRLNKPTSNSDTCILNEFAADDASVEGIRKWIGVPPSNVMGPDKVSLGDGKKASGLTIYNYGYTIAGDEHVPIKDQSSLHEAERQGRYWSVVVLSDGHSASVQFAHELGWSTEGQ